jgi:L-asparaginase
MIEIFITGGTIAKRYDELSGELVFDDNHLVKILKDARVGTKVKLTPLFLKDSLDMDDIDREIIYQSVENSKHKKIIITHGTDTMVESAKKLSTIKDKTIVLTGAMIPFAFKNSDALFNLGSAFSVVDILENGVYICMNGKCFKWDEVKKDTKVGKFISLR